MTGNQIIAITSRVCCLVMCLLGPARTACGEEKNTTDWSASRASIEQVYEQVLPLSRISWSPNGKSLVLVVTNGSLWIVTPPEYKRARRLTREIHSLDTVQWSPDGRWLMVVGERPSDKVPDYPWGTIWLVDPKGKSPQKDLLPPGSLFQTPGKSLDSKCRMAGQKIESTFRCIVEAGAWVITAST